MVQKKALLIGCNYTGTAAELNGCVNDAKSEKEILLQYFGFAEEDILMLIDTDPSCMQPTGKNVKEQLTKIVTEARAGDFVFVHFSGHGTQIPTDDPSEEDGLDEALVLTDMNFIIDDDLRDVVVGVKFTMVADCCHSGGMLDHPPVAVVIQGQKGEGPKAADASGDKDPNVGVLSRDWNRSLPLETLTDILSKKTGNKVTKENLKEQCYDIFGEDASQSVHKAYKKAKLYAKENPWKVGAGAALAAGAAVVAGPVLVAGAAVAAGGAYMMRNKKAQKKSFAFIRTKVCCCFFPESEPETPVGIHPPDGTNTHMSPGAYPVAAAGTGENPFYSGPPAGAADGSAGAGSGPAGEATDFKHPPPPNPTPQFQSQLSQIFSETELDTEKGILITACQAHETAADLTPPGKPHEAYGALTSTIHDVIREKGTELTYRELVQAVRGSLGKRGYAQNPCLECSTSNADKKYVC